MNLNQRAGHIGIPVSDINHSVEFYLSLGFTVLEKHNIKVPQGTNHVAFLSYGATTIELYQLAGVNTTQRAGAIDHFAVNVDSLQVIRELLNQLNIPLIAGPEQLPYGDQGVVYIMIAGPDGEKIEFDYFL